MSLHQRIRSAAALLAAVGRTRRPETRRAAPPRFEAMEPRLLLSGDAPVVTLIEADNRGLIELTVSDDLVASSVNSNSARVFTAGEDGLLGTADDVLAAASVQWTGSDRTITIDAAVEPGDRFRVLLDADAIVGTNGRNLDGEFNGSLPTGDGVEGGDLEFFTRRPETEIVRLRTVLGDIDIEMFRGETPITVANFFEYMNRGDYDDIVFHRNVPGFVIQGGGFRANAQFTDIPADPPILNEPGISNTRGTVAMAKLGGNPNSATNEFFFNLANNGANLDNQNGGFTVFAEVADADSLAVMDALAALDTFNASSLNGAFSDFPVTDLEEVENRGFPVPADAAVINRTSALLEITGEPFRQLETQGLTTVRPADGDAAVVIYSLTGAPLGDPNAFLRVSFSSDGDSVGRVIITDEPPAPIGIQIDSDDPVRKIIDKRRAGGADLAFIVANADVDRVVLRESLTGFDLDDVLLRGDVLLPDDIDRDGSRGNPTAFYARGEVGRFQSRGDVAGSIVSDEGMFRVDVRGELTGGNITIGPDLQQGSARLRLGDLERVQIRSELPLVDLRAEEYTGGSGSLVEAPALRSLKVTGGRGGDGDFDASLVLNDPDADFSLQRATIRGGIIGGSWELASALGILNVKGDVNGFSLSSTGDTRLLRAGEITNSTFTIDGVVAQVRAESHRGGSITVRSLGVAKFTGGRDNPGDFSAELFVVDQTIDTRAFFVRGDLDDAQVRIQNPVGRISVRGDVRDSDLLFGATRNLRLNSVTDSNIEALGADGVRDFRAHEVLGGSISGAFERINITGDRRSGAEGHLTADLNLNRPDRVFINGDFEGTMTLVSAGTVFIRGDVRPQSAINARPINFGGIGLRSLFVEGAYRDSTFRTNTSMDTVDVGSAVDSRFNFGVNSSPDRFGNANQYNPFFFVNSITIGRTGQPDGFVNSYINAGAIRDAVIFEPRIDNNGFAFGVAANQIDLVAVVVDNQVLNNVTPQEPTAVADDFQVRLFFQPPPSG